MNKKHKILTIVALTVFAAIIGLHYVGFEPPGRRIMTVSEFLASRASPQGKAVDFRNLPGTESYSSSFNVSDIDFQRSNSPTIEHGWYLKVGDRWYVPIKDVRMPLFALAVFYTGLLFLLQDKGASRMPRG
jgi:hypothetical protein